LTTSRNPLNFEDIGQKLKPQAKGLLCVSAINNTRGQYLSRSPAF